MRFRTAALLSLAPIGLLAAPAAGQQAGTSAASRLVGAVQPNVIRAHLEFLADDSLEGRALGTRGGVIAANYIRAQFERLGLQPAGDSGSYFHRVPIVSLTPHPTVVLSTNDKADTLTYRDQYVLWSMRDEPQVQLSAPAVFVGFGIVAPEYHWNDYAGVDVKGKIVVALVNDPGLIDSTIFRGRVLTYYGRWTYKIEEAARQGAAGILFVHTDTTATYSWSTVASSWSGPQVRTAQPPTSLVMAGWLTDSVSARLLGGNLDSIIRQAATRGFKARPLGVTFHTAIRSDMHRTETYNVVARYPGRGPHASEAVLIGAHYDHLGVGRPVNGDSIYNGAVDNASGTAAMLDAAEAFARSGVTTGRSILFMAFAAEEAGLLGSTAYAERPTVPLRDLAAVLNMDEMNLLGRTRDISALGLDQSSLGTVFRKAAAAEGLSITTDEQALIAGAFFRSDHFPFAKAGVPALSLGSGNDFVGRPEGWGEEQAADYNAHRYHQPADQVLPSFDYAGAVQQLRVVLRTALLVADAPGQPTWNAKSEFRAAGEARRAGE
jgi:Zn-dependent M28 family amino/carboxypeptidase